MTIIPSVSARLTLSRSASRAFVFDNSYARDLSGMYVEAQASHAPAPRMLKFNRALADALGLDADVLDTPDGAALFAGNIVPEGATPIALAYAGHQFGGFSPQLGDGRALLLGEVIDRAGQRRDIAFKGSGRTVFSRGGDGKSALGPVLREYIIGEAMHALGIPTSRALAAVATGENIRRETVLPGAVLTRVAASHLRVGTFQFFAARHDHDALKRLADYAIARHYPNLRGQADRYWGLLDAVAERQAALIAQWMSVGFVHGVMNTDNMSISGETIDYGPCAFMDAYDPATVFSSIDTQGRYAYGNQPWIARWNLARFAETLLPLIADDAERAVARAMEVIDGFPVRYDTHSARLFNAKLGLTAGASPQADAALLQAFFDVLKTQRVDFTLAFRSLADAAAGDATPFLALFAKRDQARAWLDRWMARLTETRLNNANIALQLRLVNPVYIARNHQVEIALSAATLDGDMTPMDVLLDAITQPFENRAALADYAQPAPAEFSESYNTFCGT